MYYKFILRLMSEEGLGIDVWVKTVMLKQLAKDRKQKFLEDIAIEIEKKVQDRTFVGEEISAHNSDSDDNTATLGD